MTLPIRREQTDCNTNNDSSTSSSSNSSKPKTGWRSWLRIHPAAKLFPPPSEAELAALAADIKNGQREPASYIRDDKGNPVLVDGCSRLDARELAGLKIELSDPAVFEQLGNRTDIDAFVTSANIHRRHLTGEQKRDHIAILLKADPTKSNRTVAQATQTDHKTVAAVRAEREATGEIPQLKETTGKDGKTRKRPAKKPKADKSHIDPPLKKPLPDCPICEGSGTAPMTISTACGLKISERPHGFCPCRLREDRRGNPTLYDDLNRLRKKAVASEGCGGAADPEPERKSGPRLPANPLVDAWDKAGPKQRRDFVLARKIEIMKAEQQIEAAPVASTITAAADEYPDMPDVLRRMPNNGRAS
jgi:hypothetical protein